MKRNASIAISIVVALLLFFCLILYLKQMSHRDDWKIRTTPLPKETRDLLCDRFGLPPDNSLCRDNKDVYALDFFTVIRDSFRPYEEYQVEISKAATYDDVEEKLGTFNYECEAVVHQADGFAYFVCYYDLRGDRAFIMAILYTYPDMAVRRITSTSRFGD